jgi:radical SAM superfamily enzyme YgiQ (UPF0313 family)
MNTKRYGSGKHPKRILLVAPRHPRTFWSMQGTVDLFGATTLMSNAALATLMALTPEDVSVEYMLADENVSKVRLDTRCDLVAITGATLHAPRIRELSSQFRAKGIPVALGGPFATIYRDECKDLADHLFVGEAEYTWPQFLRDWTGGRAEARYVQEAYIDLAFSPPPDWSLIKAADYLNVGIQTSRGCPNNCDFCDVIQYMGRQYRTKSIDQILTELRNAHATGIRSVFFSDDNFMGDKAFTKNLLRAVIDWNSSLKRPLSFSTQITIQAGDDDELLSLLADARFSVLFLGLETVRSSSLKEVHKSANASRDPTKRVRNITRHGILPFVGLIVGFDNDDEQVFDELDRFIEETPAPVVGISLLNAPKHTALYERLQKENRLVGRDFSGEWQLETNVIPKNMSAERLKELYWKLFRRVYEPERYELRLRNWIKQIEYTPALYPKAETDHKLLFKAFPVIWRFFTTRASVRKVFFANLRWAWQNERTQMSRMMITLAQFLHFFEFVQQGAEQTNDRDRGQQETDSKRRSFPDRP